MRLFLATLALVCTIGSAQAQPMRDDRYFVAWGGMGHDVIKAMRCAQRPCRHVLPRRHKRRHAVAHRKAAPLPRVQPAASAATPRAVAPAPNLARGLARELAAGVKNWPAPLRFIRGRLICALNVNAALAERGIKGTGSALAKSFLRWGRAAPRPVPGAVAIFNRGRDRRLGHVAIVARVERGRVLLWNPSTRGWRLTAYRRAPIAYRVAG